MLNYSDLPIHTQKVNSIMTRFLYFIGARLKRRLSARTPIPSPTLGQVTAALSALGVLGLVYLFGAAVMYFQLPSYDFLDKAFGGAKAWQARGESTIPYLTSDTISEVRQQEGITVDQAKKTWDGFTLYTMTEGARATLIDMRGKVVHRWELPFSQAWSHPPHIEDPLADNRIHWFHTYLYGNGDLLVIYHCDGDTPYGYGLVKVDKKSKLLWSYANNVHHDLDVGEDGTIYTLTQKIVREPPAGLEFLPAPYLADFLVVLSPEGRKLESIPLAEAFAKSPYALTLASGRKGGFVIPFGNGPRITPATDSSTPPGATGPNADPKNDVFHTNNVKVLSRALAAKFPLFKAGQVLLSLRSLDALAVLDRRTHSVAWAAQGIWRAQHDAEFLDNGHLLLYDNSGSMKGTRILEYDPLTQAIPWAYTNEDSTSFSAVFRGMKQRLPNGNTFIVDPGNRRLFEVTPDKELVWENFCPLAPVPQSQRPRGHAVTGARRYSADELTFLKGAARPRP
jgi:hypothetical protein